MVIICHNNILEPLKIVEEPCWYVRQKSFEMAHTMTSGVPDPDGHYGEAETSQSEIPS